MSGAEVKMRKQFTFKIRTILALFICTSVYICGTSFDNYHNWVGEYKIESPRCALSYVGVHCTSTYECTGNKTILLVSDRKLITGLLFM